MKTVRLISKTDTLIFFRLLVSLRNGGNYILQQSHNSKNPKPTHPKEKKKKITVKQSVRLQSCTKRTAEFRERISKPFHSELAFKISRELQIDFLVHSRPE